MELVGRKQHGEHDYEEDVKIGTQPTIYHRSSFSTILRSYVVQQLVGEAASVPSLLFLSCFLTNLGDSMEHAEIFFERKKEAKLFLFASFLISKKVEGSLTNDLRSDSGATPCASFCFVGHHLNDIYIQKQRGKQHLPRHFAPCFLAFQTRHTVSGRRSSLPSASCCRFEIEISRWITPDTHVSLLVSLSLSFFFPFF